MQRSKTVGGLVDDCVRGIKSGRPISAAQLTQSGISWKNFESIARETLHKHFSLNTHVEDQVKTAVLSRQLDELDKSDQDERKALIQHLLENEKLLAELDACSGKVSEALRAGYMPAVIEQQYKVISISDAIDSNTLLFELKTIAKTREHKADPTKSAILDQQLEDVRAALAVRFIERCRLSAFLQKDKKVYQAEKMLDEALKQQIPPEALKSPFVADLKSNATRQLARMHVENNLLEQFDYNLPKFGKKEKDGFITQEELKNALARGSDDSFRVFTQFLTDNYKYLTRKHWTIFSKEGITRSDIVDYEREREKNINDLKI